MATSSADSDTRLTSANAFNDASPDGTQIGPDGKPIPKKSLQQPLSFDQLDPSQQGMMMLLAFIMFLFGDKSLFGKASLSDVQNAFKGYGDNDAADDDRDFSSSARFEKLRSSAETKVSPLDTKTIPTGDRQKSVVAAMPHAAEAAGVSPDLLKGLWGVESGFGKNLISPTGCKGDFQFTRGTFRSVMNTYNDQIAFSIEKDLGNKALADKVRSFKGASANNIESYRNDPVIATYAAAFYSKEVAQAVKVDPKLNSSFGEIYAGYNVGPGNALKLKKLETSGSDASAKAVLGYVAQVNPMFYKGGANGAEALANYQKYVEVRAKDFDRAFGGTALVSERNATPPATAAANPSALSLAGHNISAQYNPDLAYGKTATRDAKPFDSIVMHVSGKPTIEQSVAYSQSVDQARGGQFGYHFLVGRNGEIIQTAPLDKRTNHIKPDLDKSFGNDRSLGIALVGAAHGATPQQLKAAADLTLALQKQYRIRNDRVAGHGTIQSDRASSFGPEDHDHGREGAEVLAYIRDQHKTLAAAAETKPAAAEPSKTTPAVAAKETPAVVAVTTESKAAASFGGTSLANWIAGKAKSGIEVTREFLAAASSEAPTADKAPATEKTATAEAKAEAGKPAVETPKTADASSPAARKPDEETPPAIAAAKSAPAVPAPV